MAMVSVVMRRRPRRSFLEAAELATPPQRVKAQEDPAGGTCAKHPRRELEATIPNKLLSATGCLTAWRSAASEASPLQRPVRHWPSRVE